jgi:hypothetical protein
MEWHHSPHVNSDSRTVHKKIVHTVSIRTVGTLILADHIFITLSNVSSILASYKEKLPCS